MNVVIDYGAGNIRSMCDALTRAGAEYEVTADTGLISKADRVIIPGVGEASCAMHRLNELGLSDIIRSLKVPVLGVCIGMQLLCRKSEEGNVDCLGIFPTEVRKLISTDQHIKIPHMGWDTIGNLKGPLFDGLDNEAWVYYVHSYAVDLCKATIAETNYCTTFSGALQHENFYGVQFHPEKSADAGARIITNFLKL